MIPKRSERVNELIKRELSNILQREISDPRLGFVSVTKVTVTKDIKQAQVLISVLGDETAKKKSMEALHHAKKYIRELLAGRVKLRYMPDLFFYLDTTIEYNAHITDVINKLKHEEGWE